MRWENFKRLGHHWAPVSSKAMHSYRRRQGYGNPASLNNRLSALICVHLWLNLLLLFPLHPLHPCRKNYRTASATGYWLLATGYWLLVSAAPTARQVRTAPLDMVTWIGVSVNMKASWAQPASADRSAISRPTSS